MFDFARDAENPKRRTNSEKDGPRPRSRMNWQSPFLWYYIQRAAKDPSVRYTMSATGIVKILQKQSPLFRSLTSQVLGRWIDRETLTWKLHILARVKASAEDRSRGTARKGILV